MDVTLNQVFVCIPIFNDWQSVSEILPALDTNPKVIGILLVDDGSTVPPPTDSLRKLMGSSTRLEVMELTSNVGHQRAIASGLAAIDAKFSCDGVVVMDGDGQDDPAHIDDLVNCSQTGEQNPIVFARRSRRTEGLGFRLGYIGFKVFHRCLTGRECDIGNFSYVPSNWLRRIVHSPALWSHYAASVICSRLPTEKVDCARRLRSSGHSHMHLTALVVHGLRAISVFGEIVGVRLALTIASLIALSTIGLGVVVYTRTMTQLAIPGWATSAAGLLAVLILNLSIMLMASFLLTLSARQSGNVIVGLNWRHYVSKWH